MGTRVPWGLGSDRGQSQTTWAAHSDGLMQRGECRHNPAVGIPCALRCNVPALNQAPGTVPKHRRQYLPALAFVKTLLDWRG